ncbi:TPA: dcm methylase, partial [Klebsiella pneumoniae]|nr:dcm methylase [Klebsiella pneumoniae]HBW7760664.1 dcm methylase [Klebsiella pneumoniae]
TDWYPDNRIHECPPSDERANIRSATPLGFAKAVFLSNAPHLNKKREAA